MNPGHFRQKEEPENCVFMKYLETWGQVEKGK